ncbi:sialate O-acetylesterase [Adhaeribacter aerolatus]|uniref:Sialate O-acetylesterase n=1 Tax=Adhaeribacter aerolatus TaxID=670289 RepID=A0A512AX94_9BACT|nr:GDSL-type esterase/lipase family protein [Adhaeribacter aerolatus]GEO04345.1 sialate O-acetylesterase [Adhaeribacter aerolatus]
MKRIFLILLTGLLSLPCLARQSQAKEKVACIGNSVTFGAGIEDREHNSYPAQLQKLLGTGYDVGNFGLNGATLLQKGHRPYHKTQQYKDALTFKPDIAIIHLGLNDTDPRNWPNYQDEFTADYYSLIDTLRAVNPKVRILVCRLTPIFSGHPRFKSGTRDWYWQIQDLIPVIARARSVELVDLNRPLHNRSDLFPDELHPTAEGASIIVRTLFGQLTGKYGGLQLAPVFTDHMVLQQKMPIPVQGTADAGEEITIKFGKEQLKTKASADGRWKAILAPKKAGGPYQLEVATTTKKIMVQDILVGEVWLSSGQSNMAFPLSAAQRTDDEMKRAQQSGNIRLLRMKPLAETGNFAWDSATLRQVNQLQYFSGSWQRCDSVSARDFSAVAYFFGQQLYQELNIPIGLIQVAVGGSNTESWIDRYTLEHHPQLVDLLPKWQTSDFIMDWCRERAGVNLKNTTVAKQRHPYEPAYNYEAGIAPFTSFPIKGVIWYQGESNTHNEALHAELFRTMVRSWRQHWGYDFPFYYTQLSSLSRPSWPHFRDSQRRLLPQLNKVGMAVTSDIGDSTDVHPRQKRQVGERLAAWALAQTYGKKIIYSGPLLKTGKIKGQEVICTFAFDNKLQTSDGQPLRGFEIAGSDLVFKKAKANIRRNKVMVSSPEVPRPRYVRYGWEPYTRANLTNGATLPASTFKTEVQNID